MRFKLFLVLLALVAALPTALAQTVYLQTGSPGPQTAYATDILTQTLKKRGYSVTKQPDGSDLMVNLRLDADKAAPEGFVIEPGKKALHILGGDERGMIYGALSVAEQIRNGAALVDIQGSKEAPALAFRAIKFNLPWDSYRSSSALELHYETTKDVNYWEAFLDMMAENRFNALTLWNLHPFPYMIMPKNFPEASPFTAAELAEWQTLYRAIFSMAKARRIDTYLVNWNVLVSKEFAEAHKLAGQNHYPYYKGEADTSEIVKRYTRESVTQVLDEYPDLTGFGFSFGEQMGDMTPSERQAWMEETVIAGMREANRPVKMIFRAPFSADLGQGGSTDLATEELTRKALDKLDDFAGPIWMEIKFNWSHGHSTPELVKVHGGELKDTYFKPVPENYRVAWMMRNEDFYALRWGSPVFIREHLKQNAHQDYVGGYFVGSENYIPAKDYFTAIDAPVDWTYAFQRQWLFYKLWGRLLYSPATPDSVFTAEFVRRYGEVAQPLLEAYTLASTTQLHYATSVDFSWDFTLYGEGMMVLGREGIQPMSVERLIVQPPLHPDHLSVEAFVAKRAVGQPLSSDAITPLMVADRLEADSSKALNLVQGIDTAKDPSLRYEVADVKAWANLGLYYAEKLRGAVALQTFRTSADEANQQAAVSHLQKSLSFWDEVIAITRPLYKDMPLTHYNPPNNQRTDDNLFHWEHLRPAIANDVEVAKSATVRNKQ